MTPAGKHVQQLLPRIVRTTGIQIFQRVPCLHISESLAEDRVVSRNPVSRCPPAGLTETDRPNAESYAASVDLKGSVGRQSIWDDGRNTSPDRIALVNR